MDALNVDCGSDANEWLWIRKPTIQNILITGMIRMRFIEEGKTQITPKGLM